MRQRLHICAFSQNCVSLVHHGQWRRPDTRQTEFNALAPWLELAQLLEKGRFDALFLADVVGAYDVYKGSRDTAVAEGLQFPVNNPALLIPAMAAVTEHLGFAYTSSVLQQHPFLFARDVSTLDHLTSGRVGWNIVTSYLENAARNLGFPGLPPHEERYGRAAEYVDVVYKLLEGSWEDDAVVCDRERGIYTDPARVHDIEHDGVYFPGVVGPHLSQPSRQRTPVLFQAGSSEWGRNFGAANAEGIFVLETNPEGARRQVADIKARAVKAGRSADDLLFFQGLSVIVGGTEEEARRKAREVDEWASVEGYAAHMSGSAGVDLGAYALDEPISEMRNRSGVQGIIRVLLDAAGDRAATFADLLRYTADIRIVGTPEQVADELQLWADAGITGINLMYHTTPGSFVDFIEGVSPVLQQRGLQQREYQPGTLREKLMDGRGGPLLNERHPAARYRRPRRNPS